MSVIYLKEEIIKQKFNNIFEEILYKMSIFLNKIFLHIKVQNILGKTIFVLPKIDNKKKLIRKLLRKLESKNESDVKLILSKEIKIYRNLITNYQIIDGKEVFYNNVEKVLNYIYGCIDNPEFKIETQEIYILVNGHQLEVKNLVNKLIEKTKMINIITSDINWYKTLEEEIFKKNGIYITVSNNKRKSLKKAKTIINFDFNIEQIEQFILDRNSIIINLSDKKIVKLRGVDGIIINNILIEKDDILVKYFKKLNLYDEFDYIDLYESVTYFSNENIKDDVRIEGVIGTKSEIDKNEFTRNILNFS